MSAVGKRYAMADGGFGDPDLTPKPLRISKRDHCGTSNATTFNSSPILNKSQTQHSLYAIAPSKRNSTRINATQLDPSSEGLNAPISQWGRRNTVLRVHKQRQSAPVNPTSTKPIGSLPFIPPARSRNSCPTMSQWESSSDASNVITVSRPSDIRAFSTGTPKRPNLLSPVHEIWSPPSATSRLTRRQQRAVTNIEASHKDLDTFNPLSHQELRKQHIKPSIVARMMSNLTNRTHIGRTASRGRDDGAQAPEDYAPRAPSRIRRDMHAFRQRDPITRDDADCEHDLHHAPMPFPPPPVSDASSSTTARSLESRRSSKPIRFREFCKPADAILMGAELFLTPEYEPRSSEKERNMLVSLDISGTTNSTSDVQDVWSQHTGLDIVVVIDNSRHTSPAALMASCETARFLVSILNKMTDRLVILCTSAIDTNGTDATVFRDLTGPDKHEVKTVVDTISSSSEKLSPNAWVDIIHRANEIILKSTAKFPDDEGFQDTFGHIFLLTPDADGLPLQLLTHDKLTYHIICPAGVPINDQVSIHCNGWKIRSLSGGDARVVSKRKDRDEMSLTNRMRVLVSHARSGKILGNLTELVLEVFAGPDCVLDGVIGRVEFNGLQLHPGEVFTVLFKLRICDAMVPDYSSPRIPNQSSESLQDNQDILSQLDSMLGPTDAKVLTARLTYKHSLLPTGTTCCVTADCHVKRRLAEPDSKPKGTILVEKRLAYHLATQGSPRTALKTLHGEFGDKFQFSACRDYIKLLARELRYRARISERVAMDDDASPPDPKPTKQVPPTMQHTTATGSSSPSSPPETHVQNGEEKENAPVPSLSRDTSDIPTEELFRTRPALAAILSVKESREHLRTDEARRIWGDMRKVKTKKKESGGAQQQAAPQGGKRSVSSTLDEVRRAGIREVALRNKRSVGSETLRSIFSAGESMGRGMGAPWL